MKKLAYTLLSILVSLNIQAQSDEFEFVCDCPHTQSSYEENISLNYVQFHEELPLERDQQGLFPEVQYMSESTYFPVAYKSGTYPAVSAGFSSSCNHPLWIRGFTFNANNQEFEFEKKYIIPNENGDYLYPITHADIPFHYGKVNIFLDFNIAWHASPDGEDDWWEVGLSNNPLYVTLHEPLTQLLHSSVHNSCLSARGGMAESSIVSSIYTVFEEQCISKVNDQGIMGNQCLEFEGGLSAWNSLITDVSKLWQFGFGGGINFAELMQDMILVQGIGGSQVTTVTYKDGDRSQLNDDLILDFISTFFVDVLEEGPVTTSNITTTHAPGVFPFAVPSDFPPTPTEAADLVSDAGGFVLDPLGTIESFFEDDTYIYIRNLTGMTGNTFHLDPQSSITSFQLPFTGATALTQFSDDWGLGGQGNLHPPYRYPELFILEFGSNVYHPSFGTPVQTSREKWEEETIVGYGFGINGLPLVASFYEDIQSNHFLHYIHMIENAGTLDASYSP